MNFGIIVGGGSQNQCPSEFGWGESNIFYHNYDFLYVQVGNYDSLETEQLYLYITQELWFQIHCLFKHTNRLTVIIYMKD